MLMNWYISYCVVTYFGLWLRAEKKVEIKEYFFWLDVLLFIDSNVGMYDCESMLYKQIQEDKNRGW